MSFDSSSTSASASTSGASTTTGIVTIPLSSYSFTPYPTPTLNPRPQVFPATDPLNPPAVSSDPQVVPDFAPAWSMAYEKAKHLVSGYILLNDQSLCFADSILNFKPFLC
jgi:beta-glucosidase